MALTRRLAPAALLSVSLALGSAPGCSGRSPARSGGHQSELEFEKSRAVAALEENLIHVRGATVEKRIALEEKEAAFEELSRQQAAVRYLSEQVRRLGSERGETERALSEARDSERKNKENHDKLMDLATTSSEQLAELRQRADTASRERARLAIDNQGLTKQIEVTSRELEDLKGELARTRAVLRSLKETSSPRDRSAAEAALRLRIEELETSLARALATREPLAVAGAPEAAAAPVAPPPEAAAPTGDPDAFWANLAVLLEERWQSALDGNYKWDRFGSVLLMVLAVAVLLPSLLWLAFRRTARLRRQVRHLQHPRKGLEEEEGEEEDQEVELEEDEGQAARSGGKAAAGSVDENAGRPQRRSTYFSRDEDRDFSAIISSPRVQKKPEPARPESAPRAAPAPEARPAFARPAAAAEPRPQAPRAAPAPEARPAAARPERSAERSAEKPPEKAPERAAPPESRAPLEARKALAPRGAEALEPRRPISAAPSRSAPKPKAAPPPPPSVHVQGLSDEDDPEEPQDDEMANTQIITPPGEDEAPGRGKRPPVVRAEEGEKELLDELKDIINKKFDELTK